MQVVCPARQQPCFPHYTIILFRRDAILSARDSGSAVAASWSAFLDTVGRMIEATLAARFKTLADVEPASVLLEADDSACKLAAEAGLPDGRAECGSDLVALMGADEPGCMEWRLLRETPDVPEWTLRFEVDDEAVEVFEFGAVLTSSSFATGDELGGSKILSRSTAFSNSSP